MQTEEQCKPSQRFLFADEYFSDRAIAIWQSECIKRCSDKHKGSAYERFVNWRRKKENEIAVFTLYAYADLNVPKKFDTIFYHYDPKQFLRIDYELTQSIYEAWLPLDTVENGHKHICVFSFDKTLPDMLNTLHRGETKFSTSRPDQRSLGFCDFKDFEAITKRIEKTLDLRKLYGDKWWEYDDGE